MSKTIKRDKQAPLVKRNPVARALRDRYFHQRRSKDKRQKILDKLLDERNWTHEHND